MNKDAAQNYVSRLTDPLIESALQAFGAVVVEGPKWCGKTTSAAIFAASEIRVSNPAGNYQNRRLAQIDPTLALSGARPRLVDEWQEVPSLWDAVRYECDQSNGVPGQFLLTGSSTPRQSQRPIHSGAGRMGRVRMSTFTLQEAGLSTADTSLRNLMDGGRARGCSQMSLKNLADWLCHGGWPAELHTDVSSAMKVARGYIDATVEEDVSEVDDIKRDPVKVRRLITSLARNESTLATKRAILKDVSQSDGTDDAADGLSMSTVDAYTDALKRMFFVEDVPAWNPALRSPVRIRAAAKRHIADPSLVAAALRATPQTLVTDLKTMGLLFESLVLHDLMVYARTMDAEVYHYRDDSDLEVDAIVQTGRGDWGAFEIKMGAGQEDEGAKNVLALERKMVDRGEKPPAVKAVIVGIGGIGYCRPDGVQVVPIDCLGA